MGHDKLQTIMPVCKLSIYAMPVRTLCFRTQCSGFTGLGLVCGVTLILVGLVWYVVYESGLANV